MDKKIRILQIIYSFDVEGTGGGITRFVIALCKKLDKNLFDVTVCGLWNTGMEAERNHIRELHSAGLNAFTASDWDPTHPMKSLLHSYQCLRRFTDHTKIDIIHSHSEFSDIITLLLKFYPGVQAIVRTLHNGYQVEWRKRAFRRLLLTNILYPIFYNSEIGVAEHVVNNMNRRWLAELIGRKAYLLRNAIDMSLFMGVHHEVDKSLLGLGIPKDAFVVGTIGRLREEKGYEFLLEAASMSIPQANRPLYFVIVGTGDLMDSLTAQAKRLRIDTQVIFTGPRSDMDFLLSGMDLFICSSLWEGFSTAILEAMAAGVPVLATDIPGNRELIQPGVTGWMVPSGDAEALSREVINIIATPDEQRQLITHAAMDGGGAFSIEKIARQHELYYQQLLKKK